MITVRWERWIGLALIALVSTGLVDCDGGCGCGASSTQVTIPPTPAERLTAYAARLPSQTDLALFFTDMDKVRGGVEALTEKTGGNLPIDAYRQEIKQVIGLDLTDKSSYDAAGIHPDGGFAVGYYRGSPLVLFYVSDRAKFEAVVIGSLKSHYRIQTEAQPVEGVEGAKWFKGGGAEFATVDLGGGLTVIAGAGVGLEQARGAGESLKDVVSLAETASLGKVAGFDRWRAQVGDVWPASIYMNTPRLLALYQSLDPSLKKYQKEMLVAVGENVSWAGAGWKADHKEVSGRLFLGVRDETMGLFKGLDKPSKGSPRFRLMVSERAMAFGRSAFNAEVFWREYFKLMPAAQQKYFNKIVENLKSTTEINIEKDLIGNLTGNGLAVIYDVNPLLYMAGRRATDRMRAAEISIHIQLRDEESFRALIDNLAGELGSSIKVRKLAGGIMAWGFDPNSSTAPPFAIYLKEDLLTIASTAIGDEKIVAMLTGEGPMLRNKIEGASTKALLEGDAANGIYINMPLVRQKVTRLIGSLGGDLLNTLMGIPQEIAVQASIKEGGLAFDGAITFVPSDPPKGPDGKTKTPTKPAPADGKGE